MFRLAFDCGLRQVPVGWLLATNCGHLNRGLCADRQTFAKSTGVTFGIEQLSPKALAEYFGWDLGKATYVSTRVHTEPQAFEKVMSQVEPRLAVGYQSVQPPEKNAAIMDGVRKPTQDRSHWCAI